MPRSKQLFTLHIDGHTLAGVNRRGKWTFTCPGFPDLAKKHHGAADTGPILTEFMRRCLLGGVPARSATKGNGHA